MITHDEMLVVLLDIAAKAEFEALADLETINASDDERRQRLDFYTRCLATASALQADTSWWEQLICRITEG